MAGPHGLRACSFRSRAILMAVQLRMDDGTRGRRARLGPATANGAGTRRCAWCVGDQDLRGGRRRSAVSGGGVGSYAAGGKGRLERGCAVDGGVVGAGGMGVAPSSAGAAAGTSPFSVCCPMGPMCGPVRIHPMLSRRRAAARPPVDRHLDLGVAAPLALENVNILARGTRLSRRK